MPWLSDARMPHERRRMNADPSPRQRFVHCLSPAGMHRMAYREWGDADNRRVLVCVHGLTRVGNDFDRLARALCRDYRVACPDVVGRGASDWLRDPRFYGVPQYVADMVTLLARLDGETVDWVGTSMGGLIGIMLAGQPGAAIRRMVINDVGPTLDASAVARINEYLGKAVRFASVDEAIDYVARVSEPFGLKTRDEWREITLPVIRRVDDEHGPGWVLHYDPRIREPFKAVTPEVAAAGEAATWALYENIAAQVLLTRGAESDLLSAATARRMATTGPRARLVEFARVGHAPMFMHDDQIAVVRDFLLE
jgi:pimeloyl-ACP methyl ester carboxylesterase